MSDSKKGEGGGNCESCLQRRPTYPANLSSDSGGGLFGFLGFGKSSSSNSNESCGCAEQQDPCKKVDACKKDDASGKKDKCPDCGKEDCDCKKLSPGFKKPTGTTCPPWPAPTIPALCKPPWLVCPAKITVPPYPIPKGVTIRPISEGGRNNKCPGGKCAKCGVVHPSGGTPRVSAQCPMMRPKCPTAATKAEAEGKNGSFLSKISSMFSFGGKEKGDKK